MFKLPQLPTNSKEASRFEGDVAVEGLPCFRYNDVKKGHLIGSGGFGKVYLGKYKNKDAVVKELVDAEEQDVLREAKFLSKLNHENQDLDLDGRLLWCMLEEESNYA